MWTLFQCPVSSRGKELCPCDTGWSLFRDWFLLESCWQSSTAVAVTGSDTNSATGDPAKAGTLGSSPLACFPHACLDWKWGIIPLIPWFPDPKLNFLEMQRDLGIFLLLLFRNPTAKHTKAETWVVFWFSFIFALSGFKCNRIYTKNVNM